jgi:hypothetical protein
MKFAGIGLNLKIMKAQTNNVEGGSPSQGGPKGKAKQKDDSRKPSGLLKQESIQKSEKVNMTRKKGYNETPETVPVKGKKA